MDERTPHTWNNERWVIDRLVDAVEAGDTDAKQALGQRLLDGIGEDNWNAWHVIDVGQFLPLTFLDPANTDDDDLERLCEGRADVVLNGGELIGAELAQWCDIVVERAFAPGEFDREMRWFIIEVRRTGRRVAHIASFGYVAGWVDWYDLPNTSFVAAYGTYTEALNALRSGGFTGPKDYAARASELLAEK